MGSPRAVLFDIDGTLLVTGGAGAVAWQRAFEELHGIEANIAEHTHAGMTDPEIAEIVFREVIGRDGSAEERAKAIAAYLEPPARRGRRIERLPGDAGDRGDPAAADRAAVSCSASSPATSRRRPRSSSPAADLNRFFAFGGYGSDARDRTELTRRPLERGGAVSGGTARPTAPDRRRRHPPRRQSRPRRRHPGRRRRHRQLLGRRSSPSRRRLGHLPTSTDGFPA